MTTVTNPESWKC